ncbi:LacI family DNA-binding transcriptional regulator [Actinoplanes sp. NPDC051633]|uniref:LacI family DNA-binding transcriptional regulator n=1 Tax=Actinoplanes sp. NPDC051633 TaxID=3155670 RepID=UPI0034366BD9
MARAPTIYDVAREAGVAASTVSRAYARPGRVSARTARAIFDAAERLGYRTDRLGGPAGHDHHMTKAIGLVVADVTNPFYGEIIKGAYEAARDEGYHLILSHTSESPELERESIEREFGAVDALVIASSRMSDSTLRVIAKQKALVLLNRTIPEVSCLISDNQRGVRRAVEHLGMLGHESILYVSGPAESWPEGIRWRALRETAMELELDVRRLGPNPPTMSAGFNRARRVARLGATAVLAYNDQLAIGVMKGLRTLGLRVPHDVSVVGFDNIAFGEITEPTLTTVAAPLRHMGATSVRNCIAVLRGALPSAPPLVLPIRLVERQSTGPRRGLDSPS